VVLAGLLLALGRLFAVSAVASLAPVPAGELVSARAHALASIGARAVGAEKLRLGDFFKFSGLQVEQNQWFNCGFAVMKVV
jgi:hypothetical protein